MTLTDEGLVPIQGLMSRWVRLANGAKAHYETSGDSGPGIILIHGGMEGSSGAAGWRLMAPFLGAQGFRVYCPDLPAYGLADVREEYRPHYGNASHIQFINDFADALCLDHFHLAGNSLGGTLTSFYCVTYPQRVISFVLIAASVGDLLESSQQVLNPQFSRTVGGFIRPPYDGTEEGMRKNMEAIILRKEAITPELITMRVLAATRQEESWKALQEGRERFIRDSNLVQKFTTRDRLDRLTIPAIYLYGKQDVLSPVENGYLQEDVLPSVQFFYPDNCGHQGQTDQPGVFNQALLEFFKYGKVSMETAEWAGVSTRRPPIPHLVDLDGMAVPRDVIALKGQLTPAVYF